MSSTPRKKSLEEIDEKKFEHAKLARNLLLCIVRITVAPFMHENYLERSQKKTQREDGATDVRGGPRRQVNFPKMFDTLWLKRTKG